MTKTIIGVMGPGDNARKEDLESAYELGKLIASRGWTLLTGGRNVGVMHAASRGAKQAGGLTVGILPTEGDPGASEFVDVPIYTGMGSARNNINVLTSQAIVACGLGLGTISETVLALKSGKPVILLRPSEPTQAFFRQLNTRRLSFASSPPEAIRIIEKLI